MKTKVQLRMRVYRDDDIALGPGKVVLLEAIAQTGSISAAARQIGMSYRRAWILVDEVNKSFRSPAVDTATGGSRGGGSALTPQGEAIVRHYRSAEAAAGAAAAPGIAALKRLLLP